MIILNDKQNKAMKEIISWYKAFNINKKPYYVLSGCAGSGKSTLVSYIIEELGLKNVKTVAYTGMAASVLLKKGNMNSSTIHRLIYNTVVIKKNGKREFITTLKDKEELEGINLIVVDEFSFINDKIIEDILSFEIPILFVGDHQQLPPVAGSNSLEIDFFLDEPVRQALDNPIIQLATYARLNQLDKIRIGTYDNNVTVFSKDSFPYEAITNVDQIIACKNNTVRALNQFYRKEVLNYNNNLIMDNEKIMCTANNWEKVNLEGFALVNGLIGNASSISIKEKPQVYELNFNIDFGSSFNNVLIDKLDFENKEIDNLTKLYRAPVEELDSLNTFVYAYAITCHKSQGSEFNRVTFFPEYLGDKEMYKKLMYVGITRAKESLYIGL